MLKPNPNSMSIKSLCITSGADRPTTATFIGLHRKGVDIDVICPQEKANYQALQDAGVSVIDMTISKNYDKERVRELRRML